MYIKVRCALCVDCGGCGASEHFWRWNIEPIEIDSKQKQNVELYPKNKHDNYSEGTC